jgi:hypothetical protein
MPAAMFNGPAPGDLPLRRPKTLEPTIHLNVAATTPGRGEICLVQFIRSPE